MHNPRFNFYRFLNVNFYRSLGVLFMRWAVLWFLSGLIFFSACSHQPESSWTRVVSPVSDPLHNGFFVDAAYGWLVSYGTGVVLHTEDGGKTWVVLAKLDSLFYEDIYFITRERGWICGEHGLLLQTEDGGTHWQERTLAPEHVAFYGIDFTIRDRGILVGMDIADHAAVLYESLDLGETWQARTDSIPGMALEPIQFLDGLHGFIGGNNTVLRTNDGGETWTAADLGQRCMIRGLCFHDSLHGWAVGHNGVVFRTEDGAQTWQRLENFTINRLRSVYFVDNDHGFIVGDQDQEPGSLWSTTNGGHTWTAATEPYPDLHRLIPGPGSLWAVGKEGIILKYNKD